MCESFLRNALGRGSLCAKCLKSVNSVSMTPVFAKDKKPQELRFHILVLGAIVAVSSDIELLGLYNGRVSLADMTGRRRGRRGGGSGGGHKREQDKIKGIKKKNGKKEAEPASGAGSEGTVRDKKRGFSG